MVLRLIIDERDWWGMPRFVMGTSAGGLAALLLAARFPVQVRHVWKDLEHRCYKKAHGSAFCRLVVKSLLQCTSSLD